MLKTVIWAALVVSGVAFFVLVGFLFLLVGLRPEDPSIYDDRLRAREQSGEPRTPQWFPDGERIAFSYKGGVYVVDSAGSELQLIDGGGSGSDLDIAYAPSVSPDGTRIAYFAYTQPKGGLFGDNDEGWDTFTANPDGTDKRKLTDVEWRHHVWSPDGSSIAFGSGAISVMEADGSGLRTITPVPREWNSIFGPPAWSSDGGYIAFRGDENNSFYIYVIGVYGSALQKLGDGRVASPPAWSPDSERIAFLKESGGRPKLFTVRLDGGDAFEVADSGLEPDSSRFYQGNVQWFRDGSQILFIAIQRGGYVGGSGRGEQKTYFPFVANSDGSGIRSLGEWPVHAASPSPDGSRIAALISERSGFVLYTIAPDGSDPRLLVELDGNGKPSPAHGRPLE